MNTSLPSSAKRTNYSVAATYRRDIERKEIFAKPNTIISQVSDASDQLIARATSDFDQKLALIVAENQQYRESLQQSMEKFNASQMLIEKLNIDLQNSRSSAQASQSECSRMMEQYRIETQGQAQAEQQMREEELQKILNDQRNEMIA